MKSFTTAAGIFGLALALQPGRALAEAKPTPVPVADPSAPTLSVFVNEPGFGKDPFFPRSTRIAQVKTNAVEITPPPPPSFPEDIFVKGINILKDRRFAIINNNTVAQGEEFSHKSKGISYRARCVEIKDASVVVGINGMTKELHLRTGL